MRCAGLSHGARYPPPTRQCRPPSVQTRSILAAHSSFLTEMIVSIRSAILAALTFGMIIAAPGVANAQKAAASPVQQALRDRCFAAITANDPAVKTSALKETIGMEAGDGHYLFELKQADGARFVCQVCDEANPAVACPTLGLRLAHQPAGGDTRDLPAELDRKCAYLPAKGSDALARRQPRGGSADPHHARSHRPELALHDDARREGVSVRRPQERRQLSRRGENRRDVASDCHGHLVLTD